MAPQSSGFNAFFNTFYLLGETHNQFSLSSLEKINNKQNKIVFINFTSNVTKSICIKEWINKIRENKSSKGIHFKILHIFDGIGKQSVYYRRFVGNFPLNYFTKLFKTVQHTSYISEFLERQFNWSPFALGSINGETDLDSLSLRTINFSPGGLFWITSKYSFPF